LKLCIANDEELVVFEEKKSSWKFDVKLPKNLGHQCVAIDTTKAGSAYCGTFEDGLWMTYDKGTVGRK
jgi:hypothetical protein